MKSVEDLKHGERQDPNTIKINRRERRLRHRKSNNRKGNGLVVAKIGPMLFVKYRIQKQVTENGLIVHAHSI